MRDASAASLILDDFGGDDRTRTADSLLAKRALRETVTRASAKHRGQAAESRVVKGARVTMLWLITGIALKLISITATTLGGLGAGLMMLAASA